MIVPDDCAMGTIAKAQSRCFKNLRYKPGDSARRLCQGHYREHPLPLGTYPAIVPEPYTELSLAAVPMVPAGNSPSDTVKRRVLIVYSRSVYLGEVFRTWD
ncbi:hypothetical protein L6452_32938 [Arctium lappa]|uniref:Uncharacterized protein n=1 Tax=Arctium lappa TaxID=4217 RepID=A0ACB8Z6W9_ARCLA|nr:hypothetical protein L6452_32938 [Arctium lappa]